jgi:histidine triad (HIT) family protein
MDDCVFCKIVRGELPCYKVYEDEKFLAFLDIYPRTRGHTLVIPKTHYRWTYEVPEFGSYWESALKVSKGMQKVLQPKFISFLTHGLDVPHAHIHILPRYAEQGFVPEVQKIPIDQMQDITDQLKTEINK